MDLSGKVAVITGAAMGIGLATARRLVRAGCAVAIWDIQEAALESACAELRGMGGKVLGQRCDICDRAAVRTCAERTARELGPVDILINNAGYVRGGDLLDVPEDTLAKTVDVNLTSLLYTTRALLPGMYERNLGHVVNISSAAGILGVPDMAAYSAAKWGVWGFTESMRHSLLVPQVKSHDVIAACIVDQALKKGKSRLIRPRSVWLAILFRGLLPDAWFQAVMRLLSVHKSMSSWKGRQ